MILPRRFSNRTIIVTGAAGGIGRSLALRLTQEGARVIASDVNAARLDALELGSHGLKVMGDLTCQADVDRLFAASEGQLHGLANVAGIMDGFLPIGEVDDATWDNVLAVNLTSIMRTTRAAVGLMTSTGGGSIVNVGSEASLRGSAAGAAYTASKHAVIGLTRSTAFMHRSMGIRANVVTPGGVNSGMPAASRSEAGFGLVMDVMCAYGPALAEPEDITAAIAWLLSDESRNINGAVLASDGGWSAL